MWALQRSHVVDEVRGRAGQRRASPDAACLPVDATDPAAVRALATTSTSTSWSPAADRQLVNGVADAVRAAGILAFGPGADGAHLEGSKAWMKECSRGRRPDGPPRARSAPRRGRRARVPRSLRGLYVVKTDGLAEGKGVLVTDSLADAADDVRSLPVGRGVRRRRPHARDRGGA